MKKTILRIMIGTIILEVFLVCLFILIGNFDFIALKSMTSVGIIFECAIPCLFYSKIYDDENYKYIANIGSCFTCISGLISLLFLWNLISESTFLLKIYGTITLVVWMLAVISWVLSNISINSILNLFKKISVSLVLVLSFLITIIIWTESFPKGFISRLYYIIIVLTVGSFICTLILSRIYKKEIENALNNKKITNENLNNDFILQNSALPQTSMHPNNNSIPQNSISPQTSMQSNNNSIPQNSVSPQQDLQSFVNSIPQSDVTPKINTQTINNNQINNQDLISNSSTINLQQNKANLGSNQNNLSNNEKETYTSEDNI